MLGRDKIIFKVAGIVIDIYIYSNWYKEDIKWVQVPAIVGGEIKMSWHPEKPLWQAAWFGSGLSFLASEILVRAPRIDQIQETDSLKFKRLVHEPGCWFAMRTIRVYHLAFSFFPTWAYLLDVE